MKGRITVITHIHSTTIIVADKDAALDFYVNKLGWETRIDNTLDGGYRFLTVAPAGAQTEIVLGRASDYGLDPGAATSNNMISMIAEDIEGTCAMLSERGVTFTKPIEDLPWGARGTWFTDPDGNSFFLTNG